MDERGNSLSCRPSVIVGMGELEVVRPQHQHYKRQRRTDLDALL